jgi:midasin (ATPase involved in ribosome maturation)
MLAIDNSASMGDNHCAQLAYEAIATLMNAFNYLEVGQLGLLKFGERVCALHDLQTSFHSDDGAKIISQIDFRDETTKIAEVCYFVDENVEFESFIPEMSDIWLTWISQFYGIKCNVNKEWK